MKMNQSGRSMVEMLGVLAIVGVLSIGGIAGYTTAMNRYRASKIMEMASQVSIMARSADAGSGATAKLSSTASENSNIGDLTWTDTAGVTDLTSDKNGNVTLGGTIDASVNDAIKQTAGDMYDDENHKFTFNKDAIPSGGDGE